MVSKTKDMKKKKKRTWHKTKGYPKELIKSCLELYDNSKTISDEKNCFVLSKINMLRYACNTTFSGVENCSRNILINFLHNAHNRNKGSEVWLPKLLVENHEEIVNYRISSKEALNNTLSIMKNDRAKNIFGILIDLLGSSGKIIIEDHKINSDIIEIREGYRVSLSLDRKFAEIVGKSKFRLDNAEVLLIEGAPANVSEINKILETAHKNNRQMLLIARSFPEEVSSTLAVNWLKNKLSIIPMIYGNQLENINSHADMMAISNGRPISKDLGDTLNVDIDEKIGYIYNVNIDSFGITCHTDIDITNHVRTLKKKIKETSAGEEDKNSILINRLSGLTNNMLIVKLKSKDDNFLVKEEIEIAISYFNAFCYRASRVKIGKLEYQIPKLVYDTAKDLSESYKTTIKNIGGFLIVA